MRQGKVPLPHFCEVILNLEQHFEIISCEALESGLAGNDRFGNVLFLFLQFEDALFDRILADHLVGEDLTLLADAVCTVSCLIFHCRVPPRVIVNDVVRTGQVEAGTTCLERDKEDRDILIFIEAVHLFEAVLGRTVEVGERDFPNLEPAADNVKHLYELREDEHFMTAFNDIHYKVFECIEFTGGQVG